MAKKIKNEQTNGASSNDEATPVSRKSDVNRALKNPVKVAKTAANKSIPKKSALKRPAKKRSPRQGKTYEPSDADIKLRAYFIAERRVQLALHGDPARDWLEARRQLLEEASQVRA